MSYTPTQWQTGDTITAQALNNMEGGIENANNPFIVTLTPTAQDYSGAMDKTVAEINAAYEAGQQIVFRTMMSATTYMDVDCTARWFGGATYPSFNGFILNGSNNVLIFAFTGATSDGTTQTYGATIYPLEGNQVQVTYSQLVNMRDSGALIPGMDYRITDYETIINGTYDISALAGGNPTYVHYAKSAGHPFDLIVRAVSEVELDEHAVATHHSGDTYFDNSALEMWDVRYTIDNDPTKYAWADAANGKGVITYLKDEFGNEAGYDFKNIQFLAYAMGMTDQSADPDTLCYDASEQPSRYANVYGVFQALAAYMQSGSYTSPFGIHDFAVGANILASASYPEVDATYLSTFNADWYYAFDLLSNGAHYDYSLNLSGSALCYDNRFAPCQDALASYLGSGSVSIPMGLNGSVFENTAETDYCSNNRIGGNSYLNVFGSGCTRNNVGDVSFANIFGKYCHSNIFEGGCSGNSLENGCKNNAFRGECVDNTLGGSCFGNMFGVHCSDNTLGSNCDYNVLGNSCNGNKFGSNCGGNVFGRGCWNNTFAEYCFDNTFGGSCSSNTFGESCVDNTFGESCVDNTFGGYCGDNTFGNNCDSNGLASRLRSIRFHDFVRYCSVEKTGGGEYGQYATVLSGVQGSPGALLSLPVPSGAPEVYFGYNSSDVLKTWSPADMAP